MIVKMKKLRVIAMAEDRAKLFDALLRLGCVEISEPADKLADPEWTGLLHRQDSLLVRRKAELAEADTALEAVKKYGKAKEKALHLRPGVTQEQFLSDASVAEAEETSREINGELRELSRLQSEETRLLTRRAGLEPWQALDIPLEQTGTHHTLTRLEVCPAGVSLEAVRAELDAAEAHAVLYEVGADKQQRYVCLLCLKSDEESVQEILRAHGFSVTTFTGLSGTAKENLASLDAQLAENRKEQRVHTDALGRCDDARDKLRLYADRLATEANREENTESLLTDGTILFF
jgi:V/A-type H+-transporting ATPase subunit I